LSHYRNPEIDPDETEEYKQLLTTEGCSYEYVPENES
jgi:hypothetical protein